MTELPRDVREFLTYASCPTMGYSGGALPPHKFALLLEADTARDVVSRLIQWAEALNTKYSEPW